VAFPGDWFLSFSLNLKDFYPQRKVCFDFINEFVNPQKLPSQEDTQF
jgi:hypothetical protein